MTVQEFINKGMNTKGIEVKSYIGIIEKWTVAKNIIVKTYFTDGGIKINNIAKHMFKELSIIDVWTNIDIDFSNAPAEYDLLKKNNIFNTIKDLISKEELDEFNMIFETCCNDFVSNNFSIQSLISTYFDVSEEKAKIVLEPILERLISLSSDDEL